MKSFKRSFVFLSTIILSVLVLLIAVAPAQTEETQRLVAGRNVNMVAGTGWPNGDPYLQRQNEPSIAVSTRNVTHLLAGANDYRTVDIPGLPDGGETGDAWLGLFKSYDGGQSWISTLLPGYPQDQSSEGLASPLRQMGYQAGADPVVRAGTNGMFYYAGMAFDRGDFGRSAIFVARYMDLNNYEGVITAQDLLDGEGALYDPIRYAGTVIAAQRNPGVFLDKPWFEVDLPRADAGVCGFQFEHPDGTTIQQTIPAGNLYLTYTEFRRDSTGFFSDIWVTRSSDCGETWSLPVQVSPPGTLNQGSTIAIDPRNGDVYVAWRQFPAGASEAPLAGYGGEIGTCTVKMGFWKSATVWPVSSLEIAGVVYGEAELRKILNRAVRGDATIILMQQLIPVLLNVETGAADSDVHSYVDAAFEWLKVCPPGSNPKNPERETGIWLAEEFERYNSGVIGPGSCDAPSGVDVPTAPAGEGMTPQEDGIYIARSDDGGMTFQNPVAVGKAYPFDQPTTDGSFRTNAYPTMTVDTQGRIYVAWSSRGFSPLDPDPFSGDARVVMSVFDPAAGSWNGPFAVDLPEARGHQIMPTLIFNSGKLALLYYDFRADVSGAFDTFVIDQPYLPVRHSVDIRAAQATPGVLPEFTDYVLIATDIAEPRKPSEQVSRYNFQEAFDPANPEEKLEPQNYNLPNLPMFVQGTKPFLGDYIDIAAAARYVPDPRNPGQWLFNTGGESPVSYAVWTDNRDVVPPSDGDWTNYTPPESAAKLDVSRMDGITELDVCDPDEGNRGGMRNQNIYTSRLTEGVYVASPSAAKATNEGQRSFVIQLQNYTPQDRWFRLKILRQPEQGEASFIQSDLPPIYCGQYGCPPYPLETLIVGIHPYSSAARTVFVRSALEYASVEVDVQELDQNGALMLGGLRGSLVLNGDPTNPRLMNPRLMNPRLMNDEPHNAVIVSVSVTNPRLMNMVPDDFDGWEDSVTDITWEIENQGSTTSVYSFFAAAALPEDYEEVLMVQLLAYRVSTVPADNACSLDVTYHHELLVNAVNPEFVSTEEMYEYMKQSPRLMNTQYENPRLMNATFALAPGDRIYVTLRAIDFDTTDDVAIGDAGDVVLAVVSEAVDTSEGGEIADRSTSAVFSGCLNGSSLSFADPGLEAAVRDALGVGAVGPIPCESAGVLTLLDASNRSIADLGGIQALSSLRYLDLDDNRIANLRPLSSLSNLYRLEMDSNLVSDLSPLAGLPELSVLSMSGNLITDLYPLASVAGLTSLRLDGNQIVDLTSLAHPTELQELDLRNNQILSLVPLVANQGLGSGDVVRLNGNPFGTEECPNIVELVARGVTVDTDVACVPALGGLEFLVYPEWIRNGETELDPVEVRVFDASSAVLPGILITLELTGDLPEGTELVPPNPTVVSDGYGVARFTGVRLLSRQAVYPVIQQVRFKATALPLSASSEPICIAPLVPTLAFDQHPTTTQAGDPLGVSVLVWDDQGDPAVGVLVVMNVGDASVPCSPQLDGTRVVATDDNGRATFADLRLRTGGWGYRLKAWPWGQSYLSVSSSRFNSIGFCEGSALLSPRILHTVTLLPSGKILVAGGRGESGVSLASLEIYDPAMDRSIAGPDLPRTRESHTATLLFDGTVLLAGGYSESEGYLSDAYVYDPEDDTLSLVGPMVDARGHHTATLLPNGKVLLAGGGIASASTELFDPATGTFTSGPAMSEGRLNHTATLLADGRVLLAGGQSALGWQLPNSPTLLSSTDIYKYGDPGTGEMYVGPTMHEARILHSAVKLADGRVLMGSGSIFAEIYDPLDGMFGSFMLSGSNLQWGHSESLTVLTDRTVLVAAGYNVTPPPMLFEASPVTEIFNPEDGTFRPGPDLAYPRAGGLATRLPDGRTVIIGGRGYQSAPLFPAQIEIFYPAELIDDIVGNLHLVPATGPEGFLQGSPEDEPCRYLDWEPQFRSVLTYGLLVMETEISRRMWDRLRTLRPELISDPTYERYGPTPDHPVNSVTWSESVLFANLLSLQQDLDRAYYTDIALNEPIDFENYKTGTVYVDWDADGYRLPTESEWEHFTRGGTTTPFWANEPNYTAENCMDLSDAGMYPALERIAWFRANCSVPSDASAEIVGMKPANPFGIRDLHGNVNELIWDWYGEYPTGVVTDYRGPEVGTQKLWRGGGSGSSARMIRSAYRIRDGAPTTARGSSCGFRLVRRAK